MEDVLRRLVAINSYTGNAEGGRRVGRALRDELFAIDGLEATVVPSAIYADHLVFRSQGRADAPSTALVGHLDTVFPPGTFEGCSRDGELLRGPGVLDMKGGLVVIGFALRALAEVVGLDRVGSMRLAIVSDEEIRIAGGQGGDRVGGAGASRALVFEAGRRRTRSSPAARAPDRSPRAPRGRRRTPARTTAKGRTPSGRSRASSTRRSG